MQQVWAVGDSLTYGVGWPGDTPGGWRAPVADALADPNGSGGREPEGSGRRELAWVGSSCLNPAPGREADRHDGHPGLRVDELAALPPVSADLVIAQGGTNDLIQRHSTRSWPGGRYDEFDEAQRATFAADLAGRLHDWWRALAGIAPVVAWTLPPVGRGGPRYASPTIIEVNRLLRTEVIAALRGQGLPVTLADLHTALAPDGTVTPGLLGIDGVHPTPDGYRAIARVLEPVVRQALPVPVRRPGSPAGSP